MSTTYSIKILNENGESIVNIYGQYDGYIDGIGRILYDTFSATKIINGFNPATHKAPEYANGMECLAAQVVARLKKELGNVYLLAPNSINICEYNYTLYIAKTGEHTPLDLSEIKNTFKIDTLNTFKDTILSLKVTDYEDKILFNDYLCRLFIS